MMMTPIQRIDRQAVLSGAHHDFEKILNAYARFKVSDRALGEDLVQDTFLKTWSYLSRGGEIIVMKSFLYRILNNLIVDQYRKHKTHSLEVLLEQGYEPSVDTSKRLIDQIDGRAAQRLIQRLPLTYRRAIRMRYVQDLSLREISDITGQPLNTLSVQLHRGTKKLSTLYNRA